MQEIDVGELVTSIKERVAARRAAGDYPAGLEHQLEAEFDGILRATHRDEVDLTALRKRTAEVGDAAASVTDHSHLSSRVAGGTALHAAVARLVKRHVNELTKTTRDLGSAVHSSLEEVERVLVASRTADERQLLDVIGAVMDRLAVLDHVVTTLGALEQRIDEIDARTRSGA